MSPDNLVIAFITTPRRSNILLILSSRGICYGAFRRLAQASRFSCPSPKSGCPTLSRKLAFGFFSFRERVGSTIALRSAACLRQKEFSFVRVWTAWRAWIRHGSANSSQKNNPRHCPIRITLIRKAKSQWLKASS